MCFCCMYVSLFANLVVSDECVFVVPLQQKLCYQGNHFSSVLLLSGISNPCYVVLLPNG